MSSPTFVITPICGLINLFNFLISPALLIPTSKTPNLSSKLKFDRLIGTPNWLLNDFGEEYVFPYSFRRSLNKFLRDVFPALPVIAMIFAIEFSLFSLAKLFKNEIVFFTFIILSIFFCF